MSRVNLTGMHFGKWTVIGPATPPINLHHKTMWDCRCDCGTERVVVAGNLKQGRTTSCGCDTSAKTHGMHRSPEYTSWLSMKSRCLYSGNARFDRYGGRGISICQRWIDSFEAFFEDMGARPAAGYSIERIDHNGHYEPSNCRWATAAEQARNKGKNPRNTSGVTGVTWDKSRECWVAWLKTNSRNKYLGSFQTIEEAAACRAQAAASAGFSPQHGV